MSSQAVLTPSLNVGHRRPRCTRLFQWVPTDEDQLAQAETRLLSRIAGRFTQQSVAALNTISFVHPRSEEVPTVVLLHGFAGGVGNWMPVWPQLCAQYNVHAIDLPGFARSHRPKVSFAKGKAALEFMLEGIANWFHAMAPVLNGRPVVLVGHSFGGYLSAHFAMKHPEWVQHLVLADPWGVEERVDRQLPFRWRLLVNVIHCTSPLAILRAAGPYGPQLMPKVRQDFGHRWAPYVDDPMIFYDYTYHCNAHYPTGELAFQGCATKDGFGRHPLLTHVPTELPTTVPLALIYGKDTWMPRHAGRALLQEFTAAGGRATYEEVPKAGHQVMSDNADGFAAALIRAVNNAATEPNSPL